MSTLDQAQIR